MTRSNAEGDYLNGRWLMSTPIQKTFVMDVADVFNFSNGRTVFFGAILDGPVFIRKCNCELWVDGSFVQEIEIEGEMMPTTGTTSTVLRSVSSSAKITNGNLKPSQGRVRLIAKAPN